MAIIFFDGGAHQTLLPLTFTRPVADLRIGILTIAEKWSKLRCEEYSFLTQDYLQDKFPLKITAENIFINGSVCPDVALMEAIDQLHDGEALWKDEILIAVKLPESDASLFDPDIHEIYKTINFTERFTFIRFPEDIFRQNDVELRKDFQLLTKGRNSHAISSTNVIIGNDFFAEEDAAAECSTFNTKTGPVYLGRKTEVWEGNHIRGSFALCNNAELKMGSRIYGATTIGPYSRVGGEINNAVIWGNSSKGHDGFLGNSVLGEWCNIGADSNNSNLKNNYAEVKLWDYNLQKFRKTGLQFCGLIMADHAKCGINTMFNTGTIVGVGANVFGAGYPRNFFPDFGWGGSQSMQVYGLDKMFETAELVYIRKGRAFDGTEKGILKKVFELTDIFRKF